MISFICAKIQLILPQNRAAVKEIETLSARSRIRKRLACD
jgi:hypothetical protein